MRWGGGTRARMENGHGLQNNTPAQGPAGDKRHAARFLRSRNAPASVVVRLQLLSQPMTRGGAEISAPPFRRQPEPGRGGKVWGSLRDQLAIYFPPANLTTRQMLRGARNDPDGWS